MSPELRLHLWADLLSKCGGNYELAAKTWALNGYGDPPTGRAALEREAEEDVSRRIVTALRAHGCLVYHADAGSKADPRNSRAKAGRPPVGWPDLPVLAADGLAFFLEVKAPDGNLTLVQTAMHERIRALGHFVAVVRSVPEALEAFEAARRRHLEAVRP